MSELVCRVVIRLKIITRTILRRLATKPAKRGRYAAERKVVCTFGVKADRVTNLDKSSYYVEVAKPTKIVADRRLLICEIIG